MKPGRRRALPRTLAQYVREVGRTLADPVLAVWALYVLLNPVYVFANGMPQPGDLLVILLAPLILVTGPLRFVRDGARAMRPLLLFLAYVVASALVWTPIAGELSLSLKSSFLLTPVFYAYNALFFVIALILHARYRERFLWLTVQLTLASALLQTAISFVYSRGGSRGAVLFNSSNQLGYFALLSASILVLGHRRLRMRTLPIVVGLIACGYLALFSASKAALGSIAILSVVGLVSNPRTVVATCLAVLAILAFDTPVSRALDRTRARIEKDESYGFVQERGYDRILHHKEFWLLGAGEGVNRRFREDEMVIGKHEIHSSGGTLFFCYGAIGCALFLIFLFRVAEGARLGMLLQLLPVAGYSATHQSLRFTMLWVFLAMFVVMKRPAPRPAPAPPPEPTPPDPAAGHPVPANPVPARAMSHAW